MRSHSPRGPRRPRSHGAPAEDAPAALADERRRVAATLATLPEADTLMRMFVEVLGSRVREIEEALGADESARLERLAQRLRGAADGYGFAEIADAAALLAAAAEQGRDAQRCLERLRAACRRARDDRADHD